MFDIRLLESLVHFLSSGFAGLLAFFLTWTICRSWSRRVCRSRWRTSPPEPVDRSIFRFSLCSALFVSIAVHVFIDFYFGSCRNIW